MLTSADRLAVEIAAALTAKFRWGEATADEAGLMLLALTELGMTSHQPVQGRPSRAGQSGGCGALGVPAVELRADSLPILPLNVPRIVRGQAGQHGGKQGG